MRLTTSQRKVLKWVGYPLLALLTFVFTLAYTFPYERLKEKIIEGLSEKYDVSIVSIEPTLVPGTFVIETMVLRTRPKTPEEKPFIVLIDEIEIDIGVTSAILWSMDIANVGVAIDAKIAGGALGIEIEHEKGTGTISVAAHTELLPISSMPGVQEAVGLPMTGGLSADVNLTLPKGKWSKADGKVKFSCIGCTVGDGEAKMKMKPPPGAKNNSRSRRRNLFAGDGLTVPKLNLGAVLAEINIKKGTGDITTFMAKSQDGFLNMEGEIDFKDPFKETLFPGCMSFGFSEDLKTRRPKFMGIEAGLPPKAKQADGSYAIPTKGKLVELRFDVRRQCGQKESKSKKSSTKKRTRPKITTTDKNVEPRKIPDFSKRDASKAKDGGPGSKEDSTKSGPKLGKGFKNMKERVEVLNGAKENEADERDEDEADEDEGEADESEDEDEDEDESEDEDEDDEDSAASDDEDEDEE
ncbi:MAG: type II secretion system protein GspN [Myxococcales bacterium]|nr:type II secretion system protein GspN [Myxococcales bacterium]